MKPDYSTPILIVDDTPSVRNLLTHFVKRIGFTKVDVAVDGTEALFEMERKKYGLIISDWKMEPMDGYGLLLAIRSDRLLSNTPFIMITAESDCDKIIMARNAAVNGFISKPFSIKTLTRKINQALTHHPTQSELKVKALLDEIF
jgi:two-component system chemotaxis response regulator CheY